MAEAQPAAIAASASASAASAATAATATAAIAIAVGFRTLREEAEAVECSPTSIAAATMTARDFRAASAAAEPTAAAEPEGYAEQFQRHSVPLAGSEEPLEQRGRREFGGGRGVSDEPYDLSLKERDGAQRGEPVVCVQRPCSVADCWESACRSEPEEITRIRRSRPSA
jgi:hypothetical protein